MKIRSVRAELSHADRGWTDGHDEADSRISLFFRTRLKIIFATDELPFTYAGAFKPLCKTLLQMCIHYILSNTKWFKK
jgi:hypothetical protein